MADHNKLFLEAHQLANDILEVRDRLKAIEDGQVSRGRCLPGTIKPGKRKITLKDAKSIAHHAIARIDQIVKRFHDVTDDSPKELRDPPRYRRTKHDAQ